MAVANERLSLSDVLSRSKQLCETIKCSKNWRILVYGLNEHHLSLLSGILGKEIPVEKLQESGYSFHKNGVTVDVHFGPQCISHEAVDLLICFVAVTGGVIDFHETDNIRTITANHSDMIWKHSIVVLSGLDFEVEQIKQSHSGNQSTIFKDRLSQWTTQVNKAVSSTDVVIADEGVLIRIAGGLSEPDLPEPHLKWFSQLWYGCFHSSKDESMPAIMRIAQDRLRYDLERNDSKDIPFCKQPIKVNPCLSVQGSASKLWLAGGALGASLGAFICLCVEDSLGVLAGSSFGGFVVGAGIVRLASDNTSTNNEARCFNFVELLAKIPKVSAELKSWARKQTVCRIVVTGMSGEDISNVSFCLSNRRGSKGIYQEVVCTEPKTMLEVHCCQQFPQDLGKMYGVAIEFQSRVDGHIPVFCIPMTDQPDRFIYSDHLKALERLYMVDKHIFSKLIIALTQADKIRTLMPSENGEPGNAFDEFFVEKLTRWTEKVKYELQNFFNLRESVANDIPVVAIGSEGPIDLSAFEGSPEPKTYHWRSKFLLQALRRAKPSHLPVLLKVNHRNLRNHPEEYQNPYNIHQNEYSDPHSKIVDTQCSMFEQIGREKFNESSGAEVGLILGVNDNQD